MPSSVYVGVLKTGTVMSWLFWSTAKRQSRDFAGRTQKVPGPRILIGQDRRDYLL